jgi:hypothetical protein
MKFTPQQALDSINAEAARIIRSPLMDASSTKIAEALIREFVQGKLDFMLERAHIDAKVQFSLTHDRETGTFMASLKGSF